MSVTTIYFFFLDHTHSSSLWSRKSHDSRLTSCSTRARGSRTSILSRGSLWRWNNFTLLERQKVGGGLIRITVQDINLQKLPVCRQVQGCQGCRSYPTKQMLEIRWDGNVVKDWYSHTCTETHLYLSSRETRLTSTTRLTGGTFRSNKTRSTTLTRGTLQ